MFGIVVVGIVGGGIVVVGIVVAVVVVIGLVVLVVVVGWMLCGFLGGQGVDLSGVQAASRPSKPAASKSPAGARGAPRRRAGNDDELLDLSSAMTTAPFGRVDARLHHHSEERVATGVVTTGPSDVRWSAMKPADQQIYDESR
jgi:hypothetical protein